jgi:hypothetical protein
VRVETGAPENAKIATRVRMDGAALLPKYKTTPRNRVGNYLCKHALIPGSMQKPQELYARKVNISYISLLSSTLLMKNTHRTAKFPSCPENFH